MSLALRIDGQRLLPGRSAGLSERTAIVELTVTGRMAEGAESRIRAGARAICPEEPLTGVGEMDWPVAFLTGPAVLPDADSLRVGQWVVALAVAVQRWGRDSVSRGRVVCASSGRLRLAIPWQREPLFHDGLRLAVQLVEQWGRPIPDAGVVSDLIAMFRRHMDIIQAQGLPPGTLRFVHAAAARGIPYEMQHGWVQIGWGNQAERMDITFTGHTGHLAAMAARDKPLAYGVLANAGIPVPRGRVVTDADAAKAAAAELGWPVVVKPVDQDQGVGVVPAITDEVALHHAVETALRISPRGAIVEGHVPGDDHRLLVVNGQLVAAARRIPGGVIGDGRRTVEQLVDQVNADPRRRADARALLQRLSLDAEALECLLAQRVPIESVPEAGRWIALRRTANISTGGTAVDVMAKVHEDNRQLAVRAARLIGLDIAGVDLLTTDISQSWRDTGAVICEINAQPGLRPHWLAEPDRDLEGEILDSIFSCRTGRIPTAAITGTNGKSTTAAMLHHIWRTSGVFAGVCTTAQVRIGDEVVSTDNLSGYPGARMLLNDPAVEAAIIEMPRKGLIVFGHACDRYDVAALLNVTDDHIGADGVETVEQMAELKAEVIERAGEAVVVNADDPLCMAVRSRAMTSRHVLVTRDPAAPAVTAHLATGGEAVFIAPRDGAQWIVLARGAERTDLMAVATIPATMGGLSRANVSNAMFAAALAWVQGLDVSVIATALSGFVNSRDRNPGRYNLIEGFRFQVLVDFAHNPDGVRELCDLVAAMPIEGKRVLCSQTVGSRHAEHLAAAAPLLAAAFDDFVMGCDVDCVTSCPDYPGPDPVAAMLAEARRVLIQSGVAPDRIDTEVDPAAGLRSAFALARPGDLVVVLAELEDAYPVIDELRAGGAV